MLCYYSVHPKTFGSSVYVAFENVKDKNVHGKYCQKMLTILAIKQSTLMFMWYQCTQIPRLFFIIIFYLTIKHQEELLCNLF